MDIAGLMLYMAVSAITPGPNNIMSMYLGARYGLNGAWRFMVGSMASVLVKTLLCGLMNIALATAVPVLVPYLKWFGAAYLVYLGVHMLLAGIKESRAARQEDAPVQQTDERGSAYRDGILLQLLNIKSWVGALSIFSIYVTPYTRAFASVALWSGVYTLLLIISTFTWVLFGRAITRVYAKYRLVCDIVMCASLVYCAITALI